MSAITQELATQRWDDHRYYHHSRINQSLHLLSATTFLACYALAFTDPAIATVIAWIVAMTSRQAGHFFFEPREYDEINKATDAYKEEVKVGYNIERKIVLMAVWALSPVVLLIAPTFFGLFRAPVNAMDFARHVGTLWLALGVGGLAFRTIQLCLTRSVVTGLAWAMKIVTDPFHDVYLYHSAPLALLRGELIDKNHAQHGWDLEDDEAESSPALL